LYFWELYHDYDKETDFKATVASRREYYARYENFRIPRLMTSDGEDVRAGYDISLAPEGALVGMAVSSGVIEGVAKVVLDPAKESVDKGEILIAPHTDPGWTPLFINAAGLVTEVGGLMTHGSVVAREYGIPAVVGVADATRIIKSGQRVHLDGDRGFVLVVDEG